MSFFLAVEAILTSNCHNVEFFKNLINTFFLVDSRIRQNVIFQASFGEFVLIVYNILYFPNVMCVNNDHRVSLIRYLNNEVYTHQRNTYSNLTVERQEKCVNYIYCQR